MLKTRILTALVLLAVFVPAAIFLPDWAWGILISAVIGVAAWEWAGLAQFGKKGRLAYGLGLFACLAALSLLALMDNEKGPFMLCLVTAPLFWFVVVPLWLHFRWSLKGARGLVVGLFVFIQPWMVAVYLPAGGGIDGGRGWLLLFMPIAWIADIAGYFVGRKFGKHQLVPSINPEKTWEGVAGAFVAVCLYLAIFIFGTLTLIASVDKDVPTLIFVIAFIKLLGAAVVSTAACVLGNLFVSLLKRQANVTDSGTLLPGHGGVLDRIDSTLAFIAVWPVAFLLIIAWGLMA